jgi:GT2 family glycosyltransferase
MYLAQQVAAMQAGLDLSIILVNWNGRELLARALKCVYATVRELRYEVLVVDNASSDGSAELVRERFPQATLIVNRENLGFGRANNQAAAEARGRHLLLLNTDCFVHAGAIDELVRFLDAHPAAGAVGPRLRYEDGALQRSVSSFPTLKTELWTALGLAQRFPKSPLFGQYQMTYWDLDDLREVDSLMGACLLLRGAAIEQLGLFDEQFFMYSEEVDLCYRLRQAGWKSYFLPTAEATHIWGGSARKVAGESCLRLFHSRVQFFRKHYGALAASAYKGLLLLSGGLRVLASPLIFALRRDRGALRVFSNYLALLRALPSF